MPFLIKFGPEGQNCQFELKFGTCTNSNTGANFNGDVHFFLFPIRHTPFGENFVQNVRIVSLRLDLLAILIEYAGFKGGVHFFRF